MPLEKTRWIPINFYAKAYISKRFMEKLESGDEILYVLRGLENHIVADHLGIS
jgi:hypothetical protein